MLRTRLSCRELRRVKRAADAVGLPWRPIAGRPRAARAFVKRVEAELARQSAVATDRGGPGSSDAPPGLGGSRLGLVLA